MTWRCDRETFKRLNGISRTVRKAGGDVDQMRGPCLQMGVWDAIHDRRPLYADEQFVDSSIRIMHEAINARAAWDWNTRAKFGILKHALQRIAFYNRLTDVRGTFSERFASRLP